MGPCGGQREVHRILPGRSTDDDQPLRLETGKTGAHQLLLLRRKVGEESLRTGGEEALAPLRVHTEPARIHLSSHESPRVGMSTSPPLALSCTAVEGGTATVSSPRVPRGRTTTLQRAHTSGCRLHTLVPADVVSRVHRGFDRMWRVPASHVRWKQRVGERVSRT